MKNLKIFIFCLSAQISLCLNSQNDTLSRSIIKKDIIRFNESDAYKMLYENQVDSNNAILSTIFYA